LVPFGSFVQVGDGIEGLVLISEMSAHHIELPEQVVTPGEELWVKIIDLDLQRRRISLSIKQAAEGGVVASEWRDHFGEEAFDVDGNYVGGGEYTSEDEVAVDEAPEGAVEDVVEVAVDEAPEGAVEDVVEVAVDEAPEGAVEDVVEVAVDEAPAEEAPEVAVDEAPEGAVEDVVEVAVDEAPEGAVEDVVEVAVDEAPAEEAAEASTEDSAEPETAGA